MKLFSRVVYALRENFNDAIHLGWMYPFRHALALIGSPMRVELPRGSGKYITLRPHTSDASTVRQVFRYGEYKLSGFPQWSSIKEVYNSLLSEGRLPLIIDAGANIGAASIWFEREFPKARVVAVEPDRENATACRVNIAGRDHISLVEAAIGAVPGFVSLNNSDQQAWAVQTVRSESSTGTRICTVSELVEKIQNAVLFIVKIDIEGFEADLFASDTEWISTAKVIIVEPHDWMKSTRRSSLNFQKVMGRSGFEILISGENLIYVNS